jgi:beta-lactamase regulating signal transducer with metallopeptidase domain/HEAT repeat protein
MSSFAPSAATLQLITLLAKATLLLVAAFGVAVLLQRASAGSRHLVWLGILGAILLLPALSAWTPVRLAILPAALVPLDNHAQSFSSPSIDAADATGRRTAAVASGATPNEIDNSEAPTAPASPVPVAALALRPWQVFALIWASVALALVAWLLYGFYSVARIVKRGTHLGSRDWTTPLYEIADRLGIERTPRIVRSDTVKMPFAAGLLQPTIVLPAESDGWDAERRSAVLMHELAHIRRRDLLGHTLGRVACALYWFHPLVWSATRRLRIESERACDDLALTSGLRATNYAEHLLDIVSSIRQPHTPAVAIPMADRKEFEGRMLAILDPDLRRRSGRVQSLSLIGGLALLVMVVAGAVPAQRAQELAASERAAARVGNDSSVVGDVAQSRRVLPSDSFEHKKSHTETRTDTQSVTRIDTRTSASVGSIAGKGAKLDDEKPNEREATIAIATNLNLLANVRNPRAAQLLDTLSAKRADDRIDALLRVLRSDSSSELRRVAAWGLEQGVDRADVVAALSNALKSDRDWNVRETAAWALGSARQTTDMVSALVAAMRRDSEERVRSTAAWALASADVTSAADDFVAAASDKSPETRAMAIWGLGNIAQGKAPRVVIDALADSSRRVRQVAAWTLYNYEDPAAISALETALNKETDNGLRASYIHALGALGGQAASALARLLDSKDPELRATVVNALAKGGGGSWPMPMPRPRPFP